MAECAHQSTFSYKLRCRSTDNDSRDLDSVMEKVVDLFSGADGSRYGLFLNAAVGSSTDSSASESYIREYERPQLRIVSKICVHNNKGFNYRRSRILSRHFNSQ